MFLREICKGLRRTVNSLTTKNLDKHDSKSQYSGKNPLSNRIICSDCGSFLEGLSGENVMVKKNQCGDVPIN